MAQSASQLMDSTQTECNDTVAHAVRTTTVAGSASGGVLVYSFLSTAAVQAAAIKASAGQVSALHFFNNAASIAYVRLYDQVASPGSGDTPIYRAMIPANTSGAGFV